VDTSSEQGDARSIIEPERDLCFDTRLTGTSTPQRGSMPLSAVHIHKPPPKPTRGSEMPYYLAPTLDSAHHISDDLHAMGVP
jgi:hypothetical protein